MHYMRQYFGAEIFAWNFAIQEVNAIHFQIMFPVSLSL